MESVYWLRKRNECAFINAFEKFEAEMEINLTKWSNHNVNLISKVPSRCSANAIECTCTHLFQWNFSNLLDIYAAEVMQLFDEHHEKKGDLHPIQFTLNCSLKTETTDARRIQFGYYLSSRCYFLHSTFNQPKKKNSKTVVHTYTGRRNDGTSLNHMVRFIHEFSSTKHSACGLCASNFVIYITVYICTDSLDTA